MASKVFDPKWRPKPLWSMRRLAELSAEIDRLREKVRRAERAGSKAPARKPKLPPYHSCQPDKRPKL